MLVPIEKRIAGLEDFPEGGLLIREPKVLTTSYVLAGLHSTLLPNSRAYQDGNIPIHQAMNVSIEAYLAFGSLNSIEIKPVFLFPTNSAFRYGSGGASLASEFSFADSVAASFVPADKGRLLYLISGTNVTPGIYRIKQYTSATTVVLDKNPNASANITSAVWCILGGEFQDCAQSTSGGSTTLSPHVFTITSGSGDGQYTFTFPVPAMANMRIYAKGSGTVTDSILSLAVTMMPPGGV